MISLRFTGIAELQAKFAKLPVAAEEELKEQISWATELVYKQAKDNIARMFRNPGKMQSALRMTVDQLGPGSVSGTVSIDGVGYIALERGSRTHMIFPAHAQALRFGPSQVPGAGAAVFAESVYHPGTRAYGFLRSAVTDKRAEIRTRFREFASRAWSRASR